MPLKRGKKVFKKNVEEMLHSYKESGKIGNTTPRDMKHAQRIATAAAYKKSREK